RSLRSTQHLDAIDVEQRDRRSGGTREVHPVYVEAYTGIGGCNEVCLADTADEDRGGGAVARRGRYRAELDVGGDRGHSLGEGHPPLPERCFTQGSDRDRTILNTLVTAPGADDHFLQLYRIGLSTGLLRGQQQRIECARQRGRQQRQSLYPRSHAIPGI